MEISGSKRRKCQWIHQLTTPDPLEPSEQHPDAPKNPNPFHQLYRVEASTAYSQHQLEHISLHLQEPWKHLYSSHGSHREPEDDDDGFESSNVQLASHEYLPPLAQIPIDHMMATQSNHLFEANQQKSKLQLITENAARSLHELELLHDVAHSLLPLDKKDETLGKAMRKPIVSIPRTAASGVSSAREGSHVLMRQPTAEECIAYKRQTYLKALNIVTEGLAQTRRAVSDRQLYNGQLEALSAHWRLIPPSHAIYAQLTGSNRPNNIAVDCSLVTLGDHPMTIFQHLVPLVMVSNHSPLPNSNSSSVGLSLHSIALAYPLSTVKLTLFHQDRILASITAWEIAQQGRDSSKATDDRIAEIHRHCLKRRHDASCLRLFGLLQRDALSRCDRWTAASSSEQRQHTNSDGETTTEELLSHQTFLGGLLLSAIERGRFVLALSAEDVTLEIAIVPNNNQSEPTDEIQTQPIATTERLDSQWIRDILASAWAKAQLALLRHFRIASKERKQKQQSQSQSQSPSQALSSINVTSNKPHPVSLLQPAFIGQHVRLDEPLREPLNDIGTTPHTSECVLAMVAHVVKTSIHRRCLNAFLVESHRKLALPTEVTWHWQPVWRDSDTELLSINAETIDDLVGCAESVRLTIEVPQRLLVYTVVVSGQYGAVVSSGFQGVLVGCQSVQDGSDDPQQLIHPVHTRFERMDDLTSFMRQELSIVGASKRA